jgi:ABC-type sugar transport system substrate-binding protein
VNAVILAASNSPRLHSLIRKAFRSRVSILSVGTDFSAPGCFARVSMDSLIGASVAGELLSRMADGSCKLAMVAAASLVNDQAEIYHAFREGARFGFPRMQMLPVIKDRGDEAALYEKCCKLLSDHANLSGLYVSTANIEPVMKALREVNPRIHVIATNLSPTVMRYLESGHLFAAFDQRPRCQGRLAFRLLHDFLVESRRPLRAIRLVPYLITRGSLSFFLQQLDPKSGPATAQHKQDAELQSQIGRERSSDRAQICFSSYQNSFL